MDVTSATLPMIFFSVLLVAGCSTPAPLQGSVLFKEEFRVPDGLIASESNHASRRWDVTSGTLFAKNGAGWTGPTGAAGINSQVFRCVTKARDFGDVQVDIDILNRGLVSTRETPEETWDGIHTFLRYQSQYKLYAATFNRRDGKAVIKKKIPGGDSNGGSYFELTSRRPHVVPYGRWQHIRATVFNRADGAVAIALYADGRLLIEGVDDGSQGGAPIRDPGRVGLRGDNAEFLFKDFTVRAFGAAPGNAQASVGSRT